MRMSKNQWYESPYVLNRGYPVNRGKELKPKYSDDKGIGTRKVVNHHLNCANRVVDRYKYPNRITKLSYYCESRATSHEAVIISRGATASSPSMTIK